jgi:hypothetical protein
MLPHLMHAAGEAATGNGETPQTTKVVHAPEKAQVARLKKVPGKNPIGI